MPTARFIEDYIFTPDEDRRTSVKYRRGYVGPVREQCLAKARAAGKAVAVRRTNAAKPTETAE